MNFKNYVSKHFFDKDSDVLGLRIKNQYLQQTVNEFVSPEIELKKRPQKR